LVYYFYLYREFLSFLKVIMQQLEGSGLINNDC
jgi:hypothetical protein